MSLKAINLNENLEANVSTQDMKNFGVATGAAALGGLIGFGIVKGAEKLFGKEEDEETITVTAKGPGRPKKS